MTQLQDNRCFGRVKAQELTEEELAFVGAGSEDIYHTRWCPNEVNGEGGQTEGCIGCVYT
jgi:hypothetical protein